MLAAHETAAAAWTEYAKQETTLMERLQRASTDEVRDDSLKPASPLRKSLIAVLAVVGFFSLLWFLLMLTVLNFSGPQH
jgi:hypothetical protein